MKILLLNGPPHCGKDTFGAMLAERLNETPSNAAQVMKFADVLKRMTHGLFGLLHAFTGVYAADYFEHNKDEPNDRFFGKTPRQAYIGVSELLCKPMFGSQFFGDALVKKLKDWEPSLVIGTGLRGHTYSPPAAYKEQIAVVTDSGFACEVQPLIDAFGIDNVLQVMIFREGCEFSLDSRSYWEMPEVDHITIYNDMGLDELGYAADELLNHMTYSPVDCDAIFASHCRELVS